MKLFLLLAAGLIAVEARSNDGFSSVSRQDDGQGNYQYNYDITDWDTNRKRWETVDADNNRRGGYSITDVDGRVRQVEYTADKNGFRAIVRTNEPGTQSGEIGGGVYVNEGVKEIITAAQPALQHTGHVIKQKNLGHSVHAVPIQPVVHHQTVIQKPVHIQQHHVPLQPVVHVQQHHHVPVQPVVHHRPIVEVHRPVQPVVHVQQHHEVRVQQHHEVHQPEYRPVSLVPPKRRVVAYQPEIVQPQIIHQRPQHVVARPIPVYEHVAPVQPKVYVTQRPVIVVTSPPAYSGPRRRPAKTIVDHSQSFDTPEEPVYTPKRQPAYAPDQDLPEEDSYGQQAVPRLSFAPAQIYQTTYRQQSSSYGCPGCQQQHGGHDRY